MIYKNLKRIVDLLICFMAILVFFIPFLVAAVAIGLTSRGPIIYWSKRVGVNNELFEMPKFRSMRLGTPAVATHLLNHPDQWLTPIGAFLRKTSLDELPQIWSVICGDMSIVGPRPALFNQYDLIAMRKSSGVDDLLPGVTGWAQVNGRDELSIIEKVGYDIEYKNRRSILFDLKIVWITFCKVISRSGVSH